MDRSHAYEAYVQFRLPDGSTATLGIGDLIGRLETAALCIDDARISEAHARVSLRGRELKLLALRGMFAVDGKPLSEVVLQPGLVVQPAQGFDLTVEHVALPSQVLAIEGEGLPRQVLLGATSVFVQPRLHLVPRYQAEAAAHIWNSLDGWRLQVAGGSAVPIVAGDAFQVAENELRAVGVALEQAGRVATLAAGGVLQPLTIVAAFDTVHVFRERSQVLALDGILARSVSELVAVGGPAPWQVIAGQIWRDEKDLGLLRRRWDVSLARLRWKRAINVAIATCNWGRWPSVARRPAEAPAPSCRTGTGGTASGTRARPAGRRARRPGAPTHRRRPPRSTRRGPSCNAGTRRRAPRILRPAATSCGCAAGDPASRPACAPSVPAAACAWASTARRWTTVWTNSTSPAPAWPAAGQAQPSGRRPSCSDRSPSCSMRRAQPAALLPTRSRSNPPGQPTAAAERRTR